jgi:broad specificity phosphatase PhoE
VFIFCEEERGDDMLLFLVRHGQSSANLNGVYSGQTDAPLTELGRQQAMAIRPILEKIPFDRVYSSDLSRAADTQMLALPGYTGERLALIREIDVGSLSGKCIRDIKQELGEEGKRLPLIGYAEFGGESTEELYNRARRFLKLLEDDPCENVAAFAHGGFLSAVLRVVLGAENRTAAISQNCAIHIFEFNGERWCLRAWNYMSEV